MEIAEIWAREPDLDRLRVAYALRSSDPAAAIAELQALAELGSIMSCVYLGAAFETGRGVERDLAIAEELYKRAYEGGSNTARLNLGCLYWCMKETEKAEQLLKLGVELGDERSMYWLARVYLSKAESDNNGKAFEEAAGLLERAFSLGHAEAGRKLTKLLVSGRLGLLKIPRGIGLIFRWAVMTARISGANRSDEQLLDLPFDPVPPWERRRSASV